MHSFSLELSHVAAAVERTDEAAEETQWAFSSAS